MLTTVTSCGDAPRVRGPDCCTGHRTRVWSIDVKQGHLKNSRRLRPFSPSSGYPPLTGLARTTRAETRRPGPAHVGLRHTASARPVSAERGQLHDDSRS